MKQDKRSLTIGLCMDEGPEERTLMPLQTDEDEDIAQMLKDEELPPVPNICLSTDEIVKIGNLVDKIKSRLDEIEETVHLHRGDPDECPF